MKALSRTGTLEHMALWSAPEQEEEASKCDEWEQQVAQQGHIVALLVALRELGVIGQRHKRTAPIHSRQLHRDQAACQ